MRLLSRWAVIAAVALGACSSDGTEYAPVPDDTTTTARTGVVVERYEDAGDYVNGRHMAKITAFNQSEISFDVVQFLSGDDAMQAYKADNPGDDELDSDYYIRNQSRQVRTLPMSDSAEFRVNTTGGYEPTNPNDGHQVNASTFASYMKAGDAQRGYFWLTIKDGEVTKVEEQYLP